MVPVNVGTVPVSSFLFPEKYLECSHVTLLQDSKYVVILLQRSGGTWYKYLAISHQAGDYDMLVSKFVERADGASEDSRIADMEFGNIRLPCGILGVGNGLALRHKPEDNDAGEHSDNTARISHSAGCRHIVGLTDGLRMDIQQ